MSTDMTMQVKGDPMAVEMITRDTTNCKPFPLYSDILQVVLRNLNLKELHTTAQLSHQWLRLLKSMKPLGLPMLLLLRSFPILHDNSTVARHVTSTTLSTIKILHEENGRNFFDTFHLRLPNVTDLHLDCFYVRSSNDSCLTLPKQLRNIHGLTNEKFGRQMIEALTRGPFSQLHSIDLSIDVINEESLELFDLQFASFTLNQLPSLTHFNLSVVNLTPRQTLSLPTLVSALKQLPLSSLKLSNEHGEHSIFELLVNCNDRSRTLMDSLEDLHLPFERKARVLQALTKFPNLRRVDVGFSGLSVEDAPLLASIPILTGLTIHQSRNISVETIIVVCQACPQLRRLSISHHNITSAHLDACLNCLPQLEVLHLIACKNLKSLSPLAKCDLSRRLVELHVVDCAMSNWNDIKPIATLTNLCTLRLDLWPKSFSPHWRANPETYREIKDQINFIKDMLMVYLTFTVGAPQCQLPNLKVSDIHLNLSPMCVT